MFDRLRTTRDSESGFTLVELLIVIVILGVLSSVVVFSVRGINNNSAQAACQSDVSTVNSALEAYYAQNKSYPTGTANVAITALVTANLIKSDPTAAGGSLNGKTLTYDATKGTFTTTC
jgi:general secretion pathway protein G